MWRARVTWAGVLVLGSLLGVACSASDQERDARENLELWERRGPSSYVYVLERSCFCRPEGPLRVVVEDGTVVSAAWQQTDMSEPAENVQTMTELLREALSTAQKDNDSLTLEYDDSLGYLRRLSVDPSESIADDELTLTVSCLAEGVGDELCPP